jgi:hypothetical protein
MGERCAAMDRAIVERAVRALVALNASRGSETRSAFAVSGAPVTQADGSKGGEVARCGSPHCAGCYEVEPSVWIHPPKCSEQYRKWLERWEAKGQVQ